MYLTPAGSQTAPPHTDDRDVLIVQVFGRKHWRVWDNPVPLCYKDEQLGKSQPSLRAEDLGEPSISDTLEQGDVLYMPRGFLHEATTSDTTSLHITFAIPTADFAVGHMVSEIADTIARQLPAAAVYAVRILNLHRRASRGRHCCVCAPRGARGCLETR
eukprot:TRINITY_DN27983_c0_g1_i1.p1 TRINITY_DN27983_c0_g1~~TRINITY_DN27983_c0_g1_i1.p1  ORF type:complete len:159 (+),score=14.21 TRINITY_DN27983_c0_g1_i1:326-802(+)